MGAYPPGCTQAMHDAAFGDEEREKCQTCEGTGCQSNDGVACADPFVDSERCEICPECHGTGYEPIPDTREDDAYDQAREDADLDF